MDLLRVTGLRDVGYQQPTSEHTAASVSALADLAEIVTVSPTPRGTRPLFVKLAHFEHGAFLSILLYSFHILRTTGELIDRLFLPGLNTKSPSMRLLTPDVASAESPAIQTVVINHPVPMQINTTLAMLATLVARQEMQNDLVCNSISEIDHIATQVDKQAELAVYDAIRSHGWRGAAEAIRARSIAAGLPIVASYDETLLAQADIAVRTPVVRRVYNEMATVREAVDKVAATLSQGLSIVGVEPAAVTASARDLLDLQSSRTYLAHLARDAFVCGNGYLAFGEMPDEDIKLLPPEKVTIIGENIARLNTTEGQRIYRNVLHCRGAEQIGSPYGVSVLEPFVQSQSQIDVMQGTLDIAEHYDQPKYPEWQRVEIRKNVPLATRSIALANAHVKEMIGGPAAMNIAIPSDLYFPGFDLMEPAAVGLTFGGQQ